LNVTAAPGTYTTGTQYVILSAGGGVTGTFTTITDNLSLFDVNAIYNINDITIELQRMLALRDVGATANQQAVGGALDAIALTATGDLQTMINDLGAASTIDQQRALSQLSGEGYGTTQTIGIQSGIQFQNSVTDRLTNNGNFLTSTGGSFVATDLAEEDVWLVGARDQTQRRGWLQGFGTSAQISGDGNAAGSDYRQGGVAVGLDLGSDETGVVGISNGNSFLSFGQDNGSFGNMNSHHFGLYGVRQMDPLYVLGSTSYGYSDIDMTRTVPGGTVQGSPVAHQIGAYAETGLSLDGTFFRIQPLVALQYQLFSQQSFSETVGPFCRKGLSPQGEPRVQQVPNIGRELWFTCTQVAASREVLPGRQDLPQATAEADKVIVFGIKAPFCGINADQELIAKFVKEHSDRFIGWCSVNPNDVDCVEQLEYYVNTLGLRGLKCSPIYQNWDPQDPKHLPLFRKAESLGIPVNIHQGTSFVRPGPLKYANPILLEDIAIACPNLRIVIAHMGHPWETECVVLIRKHPNLYANISALHYRPLAALSGLYDGH
jgi:hypothetical protein